MLNNKNETIMIDQEVYDLSQTGDEVQNILDKGEALPTNPELQEALAGKQDVITDLPQIRSNAERGAVAYSQQQTVVDQAAQAAASAGEAQHDAEVAQAAERRLLKDIQRTYDEVVEMEGEWQMDLTLAALLLTATWYKHREPEINQSMSVVPYTAYEGFYMPYRKGTYSSADDND